MPSLAQLFSAYANRLNEKYILSQEQRNAVWAITNCRTAALGEILSKCPDCNKVHLHPHSCGHRSCPVCQHGTTGDWIERQQTKLLPVNYYLLTFTVPSQLRCAAASDPKKVYTAMFKAVKQTLAEVAANPRHLGGVPGFTCVLHTHSRRLDLHPHIHVVIPKGGIDIKNNLWKWRGRKTLFPVNVLKQLWRGKLLSFLKDEEVRFDTALYKKEWVVNIKPVGNGQPALLYLSKYLYRGVIQERNIVKDEDGIITFSYLDSDSGTRKTRTLPAEDFLFLVLRHVLPKGFRRTRDFGFHHGNAKKTLYKIQLLLKAKVPMPSRSTKPRPRCSSCNQELVIIACKVFTKTPAAERGPP